METREESKKNRKEQRNYNISDVLNSRQQNRPRNSTITVPKREAILVLPYLGVQSKIVTKQLKACINLMYYFMAALILG